MAASGRVRGSKPSLRPFYTTVLILSCLAAYSLVARRPVIPDEPQDAASLLARRSSSIKCQDIHNAVDQCAFVREHCLDDEAGLLSYLTLYYCDLARFHGIAFIILVCWLGLLFTTIGIAASDFFSVNLSTIASILGLSESLAGVTFLAFGNGSPDVFSTFAAMGSNSPSMAVGELIGAASFITAVVAGSMALVREFKVGRRTYVRDICFFIVAVIFTMAFLADGHLHLWECIAMIVYYVFYVVIVVGWHWLSARRKRRLAKDAAVRGHVYGAVGHPHDELAPEPYRDEPDDEDGNVGRRGSRDSDIGALEAGPRIEIEGEEVDVDDKLDEEDEEVHGMHVAAEMASSMRVLRPRGRRSTTITPIRPSLVGALEFRSALAQLQKESNLRLRRMDGQGQGRGYDYGYGYGSSYGHGPDQDHEHHHVRAYSEHHIGAAYEDEETTTGSSAATPHTVVLGQGEASGRHRALSAGNAPSFGSFSFLPPPAQESPAGPSGASTPALAPTVARGLSPGSSPAYKIGGNLAPPPVAPGAPRKAMAGAETPKPPSSPSLPRLQIPAGPGSGSEHSSPTSPFPTLPTFTESPLLLTPNPQAEESEFFPPMGPSRMEAPLPSLPLPNPKPVKWWPYAILPPPHVLQATLFPTLQNWGEKTHWDRFVSTICVPSILLLVVTLPVVESEPMDDDSSTCTAADPPSLGEVGRTAAPVSVESSAAVEPETEWQRYRRRTRSNAGRSSHESSVQNSPALIAVDAPRPLPRIATNATTGAASPQPAKSTQAVPLELPSESDVATIVEETGWNRWLVALQILTGPLFAVLILWANMMEDFENPCQTLVKMTLYTLLVSCVLWGLLFLTTSQTQKPRYHFLLCFLGFIISVAWISTIAGEVVGVLKAIGVILGISEALLGLTVFAAGNSVGDLIADITVARLGYPVMAL